MEACLSQLLSQESDDAIREAVASPHLCQLIDGLRPETKTGIICKIAGLPLLSQQVGITLIKTKMLHLSACSQGSRCGMIYECRMIAA